MGSAVNPLGETKDGKGAVQPHEPTGRQNKCYPGRRVTSIAALIASTIQIAKEASSVATSPSSLHRADRAGLVE